MGNESKRLVRHWMEQGWNRTDMSAIDDCFNPGFVGEDSYSDGPIQGVAGVREFVQGQLAALSDQSVRIDDLVAEEDQIACRLTVTGTHTGLFLGQEPTNASVTIPVMCWCHVENGRFSRIRQIWDIIGVLNQIRAAQTNNPQLVAEYDYDVGVAAETDNDVTRAQTEVNKAVARVWMDGAWNHNRLGLASELFAEDFWFWDPFGPVTKGCEAFCNWANAIDAAFPMPDRRILIHDVIGEGDKTAYRVTLKARHGGDFLGHKPVGKSVDASAIVLVQHADSQFKKAWQIFDVFRVLGQLGAR